MFSFKSIYFVIFTLILCKSQAEISDKRLCMDENCSVLISVGKTLLRYNSIQENVLSFNPNEDVKVYSYGAGTKPEFLGVEIRGKRGYINKLHFRETRRLKRPTLLVDTKIVRNKPEVHLEGAAADIKADPTQQPFEVVDGTRIPSDLASFSTTENVVSEQSSEKTTKPLDSVPDNQNVNHGVPREPNIVKTEQNKENPQQQQPEPVEEDSDNYDADPDDEETDEENDPENKNTEDPNKDSSTNFFDIAFPSENPGVVVANDANKENIGVINDNLKTEDFTLEEEKNEESLNKNEKPAEATLVKISENNIVTEDINVQSSQNNEPGSNTLASTEQEQIIQENITDSENFEVGSTETVQQEPERAKTNTLPLVNLVNAIQKPEEEFGKEAANEPSNENLKNDIATDNVDSNKKDKDALEETKEIKPVQEPLSLPPTSTETPIDIEVMPPVTLDIVTPDPLGSQDVYSIDEQDTKNDTEEVPNPSYSLPSDLMPEFKDPEEGADIKVAGGFFAGFLPAFNTGDDREVGEESSDANKENEIIEGSVENKQTVDSENSFLDYISGSEQLVHNSESEELENVSVTTEQSDLAQNLNDEAPEQNNLNEEPESPNIEIMENREESSGGIFSKVMSFFGGDSSVKGVTTDEEILKEGPFSATSDVFRPEVHVADINKDIDTNSDNSWSSDYLSEQSNQVNKEFCEKDNCLKYEEETVHQGKRSRINSLSAEDLQILLIEAFSSDLFLYLTTTALSVIFLVFGMVILDKCRREGPLIGRINKLEQQLLTTIKENEMLQEKSTSFVEEQTQLVVETVPNEVVEELNQKLAEMHSIKLALEEQIQALEKELDTSTEVGIELNKILSEMLNSSDGSEIIKENIEQMQKKLLEQQDTINTVNEALSLRETENHELRLEMEIGNRKVTDLQSELDRMVDKILKIEEDRDQQHSALENEIIVYQTKCKDALSREQAINSEIQVVKPQLTKFQRLAEVKVKEYNILKESLNEIKAAKNNKEVLKSLLEVTEVRAQLGQLKSENVKYTDQLSQEREANAAYGTKIENLTREVSELRDKYEKADKEKVEIDTKLQVLNNYFREKEDQMQKEISKYESLWAVKEGEATSTSERIRYMQEELQNFKAQNESLKQEIVNQEVELKSQISMLEKKAHESWVANRQTERKFEEARQEAAQLRNRLTLRERAIAEGNNQTRMQSPLHQNGELPLSPPPMDPTQSPPPLFNPRDHLAKSPPIPGMPHPPFLPPPLGVSPFIPPPPLDGMMPPLGDMGGMPPPHFMPPLPPGIFPGDHRPPPLGRMSSPPPVGGRYTPESTGYSDYDRYSRRSPSPPYDSEYGASPPPIRGFSPYQDRLRDDRREYKRPQARSNGRNSKGVHSSGSENDSLGKKNKKPPRKV